MNNLILNRFFTQNVFSDIVLNKRNDTYRKTISKYIEKPECKSNSQLIREIYELLSKSYRNEYFYQNTLLNKLLLGKHNMNTTTALRQIPIGKSKADFVLINGKAVVYEIKTELDSLERLKTQIRNYYKAFSYVCVVTSEKHYHTVLNTLKNPCVGIYVLTKNNTISNVLKKEPLEFSNFLNHTDIFKLLRKKEYENILFKHNGHLPDVSQVYHYTKCLMAFSKIPILNVHEMVLGELKKRNNKFTKEIHSTPYELKSLVYFSKNSQVYCEALNHFLSKKFGE